MGLIKKIKGSYVFTHMEVGKYTKRRAQAQKGEVLSAPPVVRPAEFVSEFEYAAEEMQREEMQVSAMQRSHTDSGIMPGPRHNLPHCRSSIELSQRQRGSPSPSSTLSRATTAVGSTQSPASPFAPTDAFIDQQQPIPRPRPKGARGARSTVDMQSVYFAPGRNVSMTNQQKQRQSVYPGESVGGFDKHSASSVDYYVFTPSKREISSMPLDARRRQLRNGVVTYDQKPADSLHRSETVAETASVPKSMNNPFVERRRKAHELNAQGWNSASPFDDPLIGSGRGGIDPNDPRKYLNTPLYASQTGAGGVDLLA
ncbi:hypothetical protein IW140_006447 [Coemansia sp. RSA 1813]|nr:hypothetical protein EV178_006415 [Coemansia sp. RSA 1646]KAJ1765210.1 hypothetical protein LPJ74_006442 [Coemansia sp. RSA 1843]KAJ2085282.1 hypothetical protein IW138_006415 [Coemansia sp. RSA 986]KAJ2210291.1 hypothetical protein EV179_006340 [Coemansia sp. RSA 487]KAJ2562267.1 hypothetical protein IW140_006447 [Coemansia sp. RSA 1813]